MMVGSCEMCLTFLHSIIKRQRHF